MIPYVEPLNAATTANIGAIEFMTILAPIILLLLKAIVFDLKHPYFRRLNKALNAIIVPLLIIVMTTAVFKLMEVAA